MSTTLAAADTDQSPDEAEVLQRLLNRRYSCRAFKPEPVPRAITERILALAQRTASWCNSQPWHLTITTGAATERFRQAMFARAEADPPPAPDFPYPREYRGVYLERRRESGFQLYNTLGIPRGDKAGYARQGLENFRLFGAPHVAIVTTDEALGVYGAVDCGAYVGNFMLAAKAHGVGSIAQAALARHAPFLKQFFRLGEDRRVVCGISFGFADHAALVNSYRTSRARPGEVATWVEE